MRENDLRVIKTRHGIENAVLALLEKKSLEQITVQNILDLAMINRTTFYHHYPDKYAVAEQLSVAYFDVFRIDLEQRFAKDGTLSSVLQTVEHLYHVLYHQRNGFLRLLDVQTETVHLRSDLLALLREQFLQRYRSTASDPARLDYLSTIYASLVMTSILWYLEHAETVEFCSMDVLFSAFQRYLSEVERLV